MADKSKGQSPKVNPEAVELTADEKFIATVEEAVKANAAKENPAVMNFCLTGHCNVANSKKILACSGIKNPAERKTKAAEAQARTEAALKAYTAAGKKKCAVLRVLDANDNIVYVVPRLQWNKAGDGLTSHFTYWGEGETGRSQRTGMVLPMIVIDLDKEDKEELGDIVDLSVDGMLEGL